MSVSAVGADLRSFAAVDQADDPDALIRSLDTGRAVSGMVAVEGEILDRMELSDATRVLDVGCGLGTDAMAMARRLPAGGVVVGVDLSRTMIGEARRRTEEMSSRLRFVVGSALRLPFAAESFDRCRAQTIMQHVPDARRVIAEIFRILRPGGRLVALEFDLGLTVLDHPDRATTRTILDTIADSALQGWIGRQLPRRLREAGFTAVEATPRVVFNQFEFFVFTIRRPLAQLVKDGVLNGRQAVRWMRQLEELHHAGHFIGGSTAFLVSAERP